MGPYDDPDRSNNIQAAPRRSGDGPRLRKKRSKGRVQSENLAGQQSRGNLSSATDNDSFLAPRVEEKDLRGQRKSSLRNVVRKLFGRKSKFIEEDEATAGQPSRHQYHRSEPHALSTHNESPHEDPGRAETAPRRMHSVPLRIDTPASLTRVRSPYAVEFPQSARLKPIALANPFEAPGSTLRRRKTLPSIIVADEDAKAVALSIKSAQAPPVPARPVETPKNDIGLAIGDLRNPKRRSRSAGDLVAPQLGSRALARKRSEDILFWRESVHGNVLRTSGFVVPASTEEAHGRLSRGPSNSARTPTTLKPDSGRELTRDASQPRQSAVDRPQDRLTPDPQRFSTIGTDLSRDLEDRVAKLESSLASFQQSLSRQQGEKNRRTVIIGDDGSGLRRSPYISERTPSMLVDDLYEPYAQSEFGYDDAESGAVQYPSRPSTAPHNLTLDTSGRKSSQMPSLPTQPVPDSTIPRYDPATDSASRVRGRLRSSSSTQWSVRDAGGESSRAPAPPTDLNFDSLYQMLSSERLARYRLESQMRGLQVEVQDLQFKVQTHSQRNSGYMISQDAQIPSSRLRNLMGDIEDSPTNSPERKRPGDPRIGAINAQRVVSRFSGSTTQQDSVRGWRPDHPDDERGEEEEQSEAQTPYDSYQTPTEGRFPFGQERQDDDGGMF